MRFQAEPLGLVIGHHFFGKLHVRQGGAPGLRSFLTRRGSLEQWQVRRGIRSEISEGWRAYLPMMRARWGVE